MTWPSVLQKFRGFTVDLEGDTDWPYLDTKNLLTTGIGNMIEGQAEGLPWRHGANGPRASQNEINLGLALVRSRTDLSPKYGGAFKNLTDLRLDANALDTLWRGRFAQNESAIRQIYPRYVTWPAPAQLAIHSLGWAVGTGRAPGLGGGWPRMNAALNAGDFTEAAAQSALSGGYTKRNAANRALFLEAAAMQASGADPSTLIWPATSGGIVSAAKAGGGGVLGMVLAVGIGLGTYYVLRRYA